MISQIWHWLRVMMFGFLLGVYVLVTGVWCGLIAAFTISQLWMDVVYVLSFQSIPLLSIDHVILPMSWLFAVWNVQMLLRLSKAENRKGSYLGWFR